MKTIKARRAVWILIVLFTALTSLPFLFKGCGFLAIISFAPLFCMEEICRRNELKGKWAYGFVAFLLFNIASTFWVWNVSPAGAIAAILLNSLFMSVIYALFLFARKFCKWGSRWLPYLFFAAAWLAWEHIYFNIELTWPWLTLGNAFATSHKLVQWYEITGVLGGSLWILASSLTAFFGIRAAMDSRNRMHAATAAAVLAIIVLAPALCSLFRYYTYKERGTSTVEVAVIQPNIDPLDRHGHGFRTQGDLDTCMLAQIEGIITPETKYVITPETVTYGINLKDLTESNSYNRYLDFLKEHEGLNLLFGSLTFIPYFVGEQPTTTAQRYSYYWVDRFNTAILTDCNDRPSAYHKSKLVPGTECIPFLDKAPWLGDLVNKFGGASGSYGRMPQMLALEGNDGIKVAPMICYESVYGDWCRSAVRKGANFMAVMTNDAWWGDTPGYRQHFRFASLRAIEARRDVAQAANTGISGFINQRGDVVSRTPWWTETALLGEVYVNKHITTFVKNGDVIGRIAGKVAIVLALLIIAASLPGKKSGRGKSAASKS